MSSSVEHFIFVDQQNDGFLKKPVKEEEDEDEDYLCKTTECSLGAQ